MKSHEFNPAHLVVDQLESKKFIYEANWMYPFKNIGKRGEVIFPKECRTKSSDLYYQGKYIKEKILLDCSKSLKGSSIEVINLSVLTDALITINFSNDDTFEGIVNNKNSIIEIPFKESYLPTAYIFLGVDHLLNGFATAHSAPDQAARENETREACENDSMQAARENEATHEVRDRAAQTARGYWYYRPGRDQ